MTTIILIGMGGIVVALAAALVLMPETPEEREARRRDRVVRGNDPRTVKGIRGERFPRPR
jgi:hypothetical protein